MSALDVAAFRDTPLERDPFDFLVVPGFVKRENFTALHADFPKITRAGLFPLSELEFGPAFAGLIGELTSAEVEAAFSEKFGVKLEGRPLMITVRGRCQKKDGRIHPDAQWKIVTALVYLNRNWKGEDGRLRVLRSRNLDDMVAEVAPEEGTLIAFRPSDRSFHGHKPFVGERRYVMLNWVADTKAMERELARHRLSARAKRLIPGLG
ncbi:MAG: 2OG-Fe(II) oxygenase [Alphaproteobacteria bacterium]